MGWLNSITEKVSGGLEAAQNVVNTGSDFVRDRVLEPAIQQGGDFLQERVVDPVMESAGVSEVHQQAVHQTYDSMQQGMVEFSDVEPFTINDLADPFQYPLTHSASTGGWGTSRASAAQRSSDAAKTAVGGHEEIQAESTGWIDWAMKKAKKPAVKWAVKHLLPKLAKKVGGPIIDILWPKVAHAPTIDETEADDFEHSKKTSENSRSQ